MEVQSFVGPFQEGAERQLPLRAEPGPGLAARRRVGGLERSALGADGFCEGRRRPGAAGRDARVGAALDDSALDDFAAACAMLPELLMLGAS